MEAIPHTISALSPPFGSGFFFFFPRLHLLWEVSKDRVKETGQVRKGEREIKTNPSLDQK